MATEAKWIELFPFGVAFGAPETRPVLILKDDTEKKTLPVWLTPLDASLVVEEVNPQSLGDTPNSVTRSILQKAGIKLEKCLFTEVVGYHQYVELVFDKHPKAKKMRFRADQAMSICLNSKVRFYCTDEIIEECRVLNEDLQELTGHRVSPEGIEPDHRYLM